VLPAKIGQGSYPDKFSQIDVECENEIQEAVFSLINLIGDVKYSLTHVKKEGGKTQYTNLTPGEKVELELQYTVLLQNVLNTKHFIFQKSS
jgi:hypothetical protein